MSGLSGLKTMNEADDAGRFRLRWRRCGVCKCSARAPDRYVARPSGDFRRLCDGCNSDLLVLSGDPGCLNCGAFYCAKCCPMGARGLTDDGMPLFGVHRRRERPPPGVNLGPHEHGHPDPDGDDDPGAVWAAGVR